MDTRPWHAFQEWLGSPAACRRVAIPYAPALAELVPPVAVRLRRDFGAVLNLVRTHAVLHQAGSERDTEGSIVASLEDYEAVRDLVQDLVSEGIGVTVSRTVRDTVSTVVRLCEDDEGDPVSLAAVARDLDLDMSAVSRRVRRAVEQGYLKNLEDRRGKPARRVPGDPLPDDLEILPSAEALHRCIASDVQRCNGEGGPRGVNAPFLLDRCSVAGENGGIASPSPLDAGTKDDEEGGGGSYPSETRATVQHPPDNSRKRFTI